MHPVLFKIPLFGGHIVTTYGALVATAFLAAILWVIYETRRLKLDTTKVLDLIFYVVVAAIFGSRLMHLIVVEPLRLIKQPWSLFMIWEGGLVFYGGLLAASIVGIAYLKLKKMALWTYVDIFAPAIALGHVFGRLGCFMVGCCYGKPAGDKWFSIVFPDNPETLAPANIPLYPTQLIESGGELLIFLGLVLFRKHKRFDGQIFALYLIFYSILRFLNEFLRGDPDRGYIIKGILSTSQMVSIVIFICGITLMVWGYRKVKT